MKVFLDVASYVRNKIVYREESGRMLNYITLRISDKEIDQDVEDIKANYLNRLYWFGQGFMWVTFFFVVFTTYVFKIFKGSGAVIDMGISSLLITVMWSVCYFRFKKKSRYCIFIYFIFAALGEVLIMNALEDPDSPMY